MKREILFRAKRVDEWVEGFYLSINDEHFIMTYPGAHELLPIDPDTLGQYTGLRDKNGKRIFEGDVVRAFGEMDTYIQVIEFHNTKQSCGRGWIGRNLKREASMVGTRIEKPEEDLTERFSYFCWPASWEIIGNIHDTIKR
jgi:uncharacterized phage protein (TIGR01671 family)